MNDLHCLNEAVKQVLEEKGVLSELRAKLRAEIFESLQIGKELGVNKMNENKQNKKNTASQTKWNKKELVINELILQYMSFHGLQHSHSVFLSETNYNKRTKIKLESELLVDADDINEDDNHPLLYDIVKTQSDN